MSRFTSQAISATTRDGRTLWLTDDDCWSASRLQAERLDDEAHATIRLIEGRILAGPEMAVRMVALAPLAHLA